LLKLLSVLAQVLALAPIAAPIVVVSIAARTRDYQRSHEQSDG
jgi:hypothetical protein